MSTGDLGFPLRAIAAIAIAMLCSACSPSAEPSASAHGPYFQDLLVEAVAAGVSPEQRAVLEEANATGEVSYDQIEPLFADTYRCFEGAGIQYVVLDPVMTPEGIRVPDFATYDVPGLADQGASLVEHCSFHHYGLALAAYVNQPSTQEARDRIFDEGRDSLVACLESRGYPVDPDASRDEVKALVTEEALQVARDGLNIEPCSVAG